MGENCNYKLGYIHLLVYTDYGHINILKSTSFTMKLHIIHKTLISIVHRQSAFFHLLQLSYVNNTHCHTIQCGLHHACNYIKLH